MAWSVPANFTTGQTSGVSAALNAILGDLTIIGSAYTSYTPTLTNITLGNGAVNTKYLQINKTVKVRGLFAAGTTTTYSAGNLGISLPVPPHSEYTAAGAASGWAVGAAILAPTGVRLSGTPVITTTGILNFIVDSATTNTAATNLIPGTWGTTGTFLSFHIEYEAA